MPAPLAKRAAAASLDAVPLLALGLALVRHARGKPPYARIGLPAALQAAYFIAPTAMSGGTPGQLIVGLRVVDAATGRMPNWRQSLFRWALWAVPGLIVRMVVAVRRGQQSQAAKQQREEFTKEHDEILREYRDDEVELNRRLAALHAKQVLPTGWLLFPAAAYAALLLYRLVVNRDGQDRLTGTCVVVASTR
jgi:hypothetical protein